VCDQLDEASVASKAVDDTEGMEVPLYDGSVMNVGWMTDAGLEAVIAPLAPRRAVLASWRR
jgi:hypothetical protein